jgi:hypothetical protein
MTLTAADRGVPSVEKSAELLESSHINIGEHHRFGTRFDQGGGPPRSMTQLVPANNIPIGLTHPLSFARSTETLGNC